MYQRNHYSKISRQGCCRTLQTELGFVTDFQNCSRKKENHTFAAVMAQSGSSWKCSSSAPGHVLASLSFTDSIKTALLTAIGGWGVIQFLLILCWRSKFAESANLHPLLFASGCSISSEKIYSFNLLTRDGGEEINL